MADDSAPIILVPGFWLGAWAWDEVAEALRADGHDVTAITLPGLESADADRSSITFNDHVDAIVKAVEAAAAPVVLAVHSATGFSGYAASDRVPEKIAAMVYVDTAPGKGALDPDFADDEKPMVWKEIEEEENLDGLSEEQKETFRQRAVPVPGSLIRESVELTNDARRDIPSTLICTGFTAEQYQTYAREHPDWAFLAGIPELRNATWVDLPTSHWPMWSRPQELAQIIGDVAKATAEREADVGDAIACTTEQTLLGEGVRWDARRGELLRVDILAGRVYRDRIAEDGGLIPFEPMSSAGPWARSRRSRAMTAGCIAADRGIAHLSLDGSVRPLAEIAPQGTRMNDAACDPQGRFWAGTTSDRPRAAGLYRLGVDGRTEQMLDGLTTSNGLDWSPDARTMYLADSGPRVVHAFDFDADRGNDLERQGAHQHGRRPRDTRRPDRRRRWRPVGRDLGSRTHPPIHG